MANDVGGGTGIVVEVGKAVHEGWTAVDVEVLRVQQECPKRREEAGKRTFNVRRHPVLDGDGFDPKKWEKSGVSKAVATQNCSDMSKKQFRAEEVEKMVS